MRGRKKIGDTSERVVRAQICLKPSQIEWLKQQGGISATISKLIDSQDDKKIKPCWCNCELCGSSEIEFSDNLKKVSSMPDLLKSLTEIINRYIHYGCLTPIPYEMIERGKNAIIRTYR